MPSGGNNGVRDKNREWDDTITVLVFDNPVDGNKWECQHYDHLTLTPVQTWLLHFWWVTKKRPCLLLQPQVFDRRTAATDFTPDRASMFIYFRKIWCGPEHTGSAWLRWKNSKEVTRQAALAFKVFRTRSARKRLPYPDARPLRTGHHLVPIDEIKKIRTQKANKRQRAKDEIVAAFRTWEKDLALDRCVQAAIRSGGQAPLDDIRKIMAFCDETEAPDDAKRRHRAKYRTKGGQRQASRSKFPTRRKTGLLFRDFKTAHRPTRMDLKNKDGTHFESGARFDVVTELKTVIKQVTKRGKVQSTSDSRIWTGNNDMAIILSMSHLK
jgi:hypothetical protein